MERRRFTREFKLEAVRLIRDRGVSYVQASEDLKVHPTQLRSWVKAFADDPQHAFPGQGQMKPEQLEIAQLKFAARSSMVGGNALRVAADAVIARGKEMAGALMEAAPADIEFKSGTYTVMGTDRQMSISDVARAFFAPAGLSIERPNQVWEAASGCRSRPRILQRRNPAE
jgi:transposase